MAAAIDPKLLERLESRLGLGRRAVQKRIQKLVNVFHLERRLAAILLASQSGIAISQFSTPEDLAAIRQVLASSTVPRTALPETSAPATPTMAPRRRGKGVSRGRSRKQPAKSVWIIHGRNVKAASALREFLRAVGLHPLEWHQALAKTKKPAPYIGDILEKAFSEAGAVVVLLTPDDEARLRKPYRKSGDPSHEKRLTPQARPNVLFEAGMAFGSHPAKTVLVQLGQVRPFSDIAGRHVVDLTDDARSRKELAERLKAAGCSVDTSGMDWLSAGDFTLPERKSKGRRRR